MIKNYKLYTILVILYSFCQNYINGQDNNIILAEQSQNRIVIINPFSDSIIWQWKADNSLKSSDHTKWFNAPSDAKPVLGGNYLLISASGGGVALIRVRDGKTLFYTYVGGNTHSSEILPDGNIVCASSTGNFLTIVRTDTILFPDTVLKKQIRIPFAHNVVWDNERQVLYTASTNKLYTLKYNFNCNNPKLEITDSIIIPENEAHDLFPVLDEDALWLTTSESIFKFNVLSEKFLELNIDNDCNIKSVSSGQGKMPVIIIRPKESWWTDEVLDINNNSIFIKEGFKIYKARWYVNNEFSYGRINHFHFCK